MADRNADNDNTAGSEDDNWVMPIPASGRPAYAVMPWTLFERLRAPLAAPPDDPDSIALDDGFDTEPVREIGAAPVHEIGAAPVHEIGAAPVHEIGAAPMRISLAGGAPGDLWPKPDNGIDGYDDAAAGAIPLHLLDRLLDGEHPLKVFRRHRGLTQKQLAQRTGLNATYLSQIETRKRGGSTRVYRLLAAALNVEIGDLIE